MPVKKPEAPCKRLKAHTYKTNCLNPRQAPKQQPHHETALSFPYTREAVSKPLLSRLSQTGVISAGRNIDNKGARIVRDNLKALR